jgi:2-oxoglutarate decarboxylase
MSEPTSEEGVNKKADGVADETVPFRGGSLRLVENMDASLSIPTATSYRTIPVKLLEENRRIINEYLKTVNRPRISYTHIIALALVSALKEFPSLNSCYDPAGGTPAKRLKKSINLGVAVDTERKDGTRTLLVPNIKNADEMAFHQFVETYDEVLTRVRKGLLNPDDFQGTTITLTNPGTVGTVLSLPRLISGQGAIIATGTVGYPAEYHAWASHALSSLGLSRVQNPVSSWGKSRTCSWATSASTTSSSRISTCRRSPSAGRSTTPRPWPEAGRSAKTRKNKSASSN